MTLRARLWRDWSGATGVAFGVLLAVVAGGRLLGYLEDAVDERLPIAGIWQVIALRLPEFTQLLLPLAACVGVGLVHGRMNAERELVALRAAGEAPLTYALRGGGFGAMVAVVVALCSGWLTPHAQRELAQLLDTAAANHVDRLLSPGRFQPLDDAGSVLFIAAREGDVVYDLLLAQPQATAPGAAMPTVARTSTAAVAQQHAWTLLRARQGRYLGDAPRRLLLRDGVQSQVDAASGAWRHVRFLQAQWLLPALDAVAPPRLSALGAAELLAQPSSPAARAELFWRASLPLLALVGVLVVVSTPTHGTGERRYDALLLGLPVFALYLAVLVLTRQWLAGAATTPSLVVGAVALAPHGAALVGLAVWLRHRQVRG